MPAPSCSDFDPIAELEARARARVMAALALGPLPVYTATVTFPALLEEERADADEAVSGYLKTSEDTSSSVRNRGDLAARHETRELVRDPLAGGGSEEPASCRSLAGPGSDSKSDAAAFDSQERRCNLKPEMAAPDGLPREKPAMRPGDREDRALCPSCAGTGFVGLFPCPHDACRRAR